MKLLRGLQSFVEFLEIIRFSQKDWLMIICVRSRLISRDIELIPEQKLNR